MTDAQERARDDRYYWPDGSLKWGHPVDVGHLILQLQTLDQAMKVSSISFIDTKEGRKARAYGLSMSRERWDEGGWLNYQLDTPECLAIWANPPDIAAALARVEAETWEQARIKLRRDCIHEHGMKPVKTRMIDCDRCVLLCSQQAQRAKEGKG